MADFKCGDFKQGDFDVDCGGVASTRVIRSPRYGITRVASMILGLLR